MKCKNNNPKQNWEKFRYLNKNLTDHERGLFGQWWEELINRFGTRVEYYTYNYSLSTQDYLYGEEPTAKFSPANNINIMIDIPNEAILLSKFGLQTNSDFTAVITVEDFQDVFGKNAEPKSGDVIRVIEAGWSQDELPPTSNDVHKQLCTMKHPVSPATFFYTVTDKNFIRCPQLYEITERDWQEFSMGTNTLLGHYVWVIRGKRFDYSYQPLIRPECKQGVVSDETRTGILTGGTQNPDLQDPSPEKGYSGNVTDDSNENIWDYDKDGDGDSSDVYGEY